jgi:hypothetical protein
MRRIRIKKCKIVLHSHKPLPACDHNQASLYKFLLTLIASLGGILLFWFRLKGSRIQSCIVYQKSKSEGSCHVTTPFSSRAAFELRKWSYLPLNSAYSKSIPCLQDSQSLSN